MTDTTNAGTGTAGTGAGASGGTQGAEGSQATNTGTQQQTGGQQGTQGTQQQGNGQQQQTGTNGTQTDVKDGQSTEGQQQTQTQQPEFKVPDEYKDKPWAQKIKSQDDLYKQIDTLDALKGKKTIVPDLKTATPEEREAYYAQTRPKDGSEYVFADTQSYPTTPETKTAVAEIFLKNGISAVQGNEVIKAYQELGEKQMKAQFDPDGFKASMQTAFGNDWEKITGQTRNTINGMMNADDQKQLDAIPNAYLGVIYRTLGNVVKSYGIKETDQAHLQGGGGQVHTDVNGQRQGLRDQMASLSNRPHTTEEMNGLRQKLADTYKNDPRLSSAR